MLCPPQQAQPDRTRRQLFNATPMYAFRSAGVPPAPLIFSLAPRTARVSPSSFRFIISLSSPRRPLYPILHVYRAALADRKLPGPIARHCVVFRNAGSGVALWVAASAATLRTPSTNFPFGGFFAEPSFARARCVRESGGLPPHSKRSLAAILWSAGACSRFLLPDASCRSNIP